MLEIALLRKSVDKKASFRYRQALYGHGTLVYIINISPQKRFITLLIAHMALLDKQSTFCYKRPW